MRTTIVVATKNKKKLEEIREILRGEPVVLQSLAEYGRTPVIIENGKTFKANAIKKAITIARFSKALTLGEDSGLCVHALGNAPGVRSARFSGRAKNDEKNNRKLLSLMEGLPLSRRKAHYACAIALADKDGLIGVVEGKCSGLIAFTPAGHFGFGYDPVFFIPRYKKTFAELGPAIKHAMSHRSRALKKARRIIEKYIE